MADDGPGIPEDMLERVFEPYFRLESSRNRALGGTGLGLAIARNMAPLNAGELEPRNRPEGGLMARGTLPDGDYGPSAGEETRLGGTRTACPLRGVSQRRNRTGRGSPRGQ